MKNAETTVAKLVEVALRRYSMIDEGDRILLAVSGGKDSLTMAYDLAKKRAWWPARYEIKALRVLGDFPASGDNSREVGRLMEEWGIEYTTLPVPILGRLKPGRAMNCYWCSTQRRTELIRYAMANGFNKIALGHHLDDIVETLLMNMLHKGQISGMLPLLSYSKYPVKIMRPLALCEERQVIAFADEKGFRSVTCTCDYGQESRRREVRARIALLTGGSSDQKRNLFESMSNVNLDYLA